MTPAVRDCQEADWPEVWAIIAEVVRAADSFPYDPRMTEADARGWLAAPPGRTTVAVAGGRVLGTATMGANRDGPGDHVATGSVMVDRGERGRGVGRALCADLVEWARSRGFAGIQFNAVVETNAAAVALYRDLGWEVLGTVPGAFRHPSQGRVGLHLMYLDLTSGRTAAP